MYRLKGLRGNSMEKIKKVSSYQIILLIIIYRMIIAFTYGPAINTPPGNQDVWIALLLSIPYTILIYLPILFLSNKFNNLTIIEYMEKIFGKFIGKLVGFFYTVSFLISCTIIVATVLEMLGSTIFPETPVWVTSLFMMTTCTYISSKGLESIARGAEILVPFIIGILFLILALGYKNMDFTVLLPILSDSTFKSINIGAIDFAFKFPDVLILAMITPHLEKKGEFNKIFFKSLIYSMLMVTIIVIASQAALGVEQAKHSNFPFFTYARLINLLDFIQRIESLYVVSWIAGNIGKISGYLYFTTVALNQTTKRKENKSYIIPIGIIIVISSVIIKDRHSIIGTPQSTSRITLIISLISMLIIPLIALIVYFLRSKIFKNVNSQ